MGGCGRPRSLVHHLYIRGVGASPFAPVHHSYIIPSARAMWGHSWIRTFLGLCLLIGTFLSHQISSGSCKNKKLRVCFIRPEKKTFKWSLKSLSDFLKHIVASKFEKLRILWYQKVLSGLFALSKMDLCDQNSKKCVRHRIWKLKVHAFQFQNVLSDHLSLLKSDFSQFFFIMPKHALV